jgi:hypothetical protein
MSRFDRTAPRERFSGGYLGHGRIEPMEGARARRSVGKMLAACLVFVALYAAFASYLPAGW